MLITALEMVISCQIRVLTNTKPLFCCVFERLQLLFDGIEFSTKILCFILTWLQLCWNGQKWHWISIFSSVFKRSRALERFLVLLFIIFISGFSNWSIGPLGPPRDPLHPRNPIYYLTNNLLFILTSFTNYYRALLDWKFFSHVEYTL